MIKIREYKNQDWEKICEIHDLARKEELKGSVDLKAFKTLEETYKNEGLFDGEVLVATYEETVKGFISFEPKEITWLYVNPSSYRYGIGSCLLKAALKKCENTIVAEVLYKNTRAISFYQKHGFKIISKIEGVLEGNESYKTSGYILQMNK